MDFDFLSLSLYEFIFKEFDFLILKRHFFIFDSSEDGVFEVAYGESEIPSISIEVVFLLQIVLEPLSIIYIYQVVL